MIYFCVTNFLIYINLFGLFKTCFDLSFNKGHYPHIFLPHFSSLLAVKTHILLISFTNLYVSTFIIIQSGLFLFSSAEEQAEETIHIE